MVKVKNKITILLLGGIIVFLIFVLVIRCLLISAFDGYSSSDRHSKEVKFETLDQSLYIHTAVWGITGDHYFISISEKDINSSKEGFVFYDPEAYYRIAQPDTLFLFIPTPYEKGMESHKIGDINLIIQKSTLANMDDKQTFSKISIYDGIE